MELLPKQSNDNMYSLSMLCQFHGLSLTPILSREGHILFDGETALGVVTELSKAHSEKAFSRSHHNFIAKKRHLQELCSALTTLFPFLSAPEKCSIHRRAVVKHFIRQLLWQSLEVCWSALLSPHRVDTVWRWVCCGVLLNTPSPIDGTLLGIVHEKTKCDPKKDIFLSL